MGNGESKDGETEAEMADVENPAVGVEANGEDGADGEGAQGEGAQAAPDGDFERKQRELNDELKNAKECIIKVKMAEGKGKKKKKTNDDGEDEGSEAKREFNRALKEANKLYKELTGIQKLDQATHTEIMKQKADGKSIKKGYLITDEVIKDRKKLVPMFKVQIDKVKGSMKQKSTQRERPVKPVYIPPADVDLSPEEMAEEKAQAEAAGGVEADALADLPDLAPESAAAYKEFCLREEKTQKMQQILLESLQKQEEVQNAVADESKVQDELCAAQGEALESAIEAGTAANEAADKFLDEHGEGGMSTGKQVCYAVLILIILGGGAYVYMNKDKLTSTENASRRSDDEYDQTTVNLSDVLPMLIKHMTGNV